MRTPATPPESTPPLQSCLSQWLDKQTRHLSADYRQYLQDELQKIVSYQATIGVMGKSGTGKSSCAMHCLAKRKQRSVM
jgi:DNA-binding NtrC family response regulator